MKKIHIRTSSSYDMLIGNGITGELHSIVSTYAHILVVSDETVFSLHGKRICTALQGCDYSCCIIPDGEENKTLEMLGRILQRAAEHSLNRWDCMIAFGGGVVGDITGLAAAVYMRGIDFIQIPTTLLSAVDASVGGKTAVDLPQGKNLVGAFHQPVCVLCDCELLSTLPARQFSSGMAEVIKHGILRDEIILGMIADGTAGDLEDLIARNISVKQAIVEADEHETGFRKILNFGHTVGHAVELLTNYSFLHGEAVAIGMLTELRLGESLKITAPALTKRTGALLKAWNLPIQADIPREALIEAMLSDKKNRDGKIVFEIPEGAVVIREIALTENELLTMVF